MAEGELRYVAQGQASIVPPLSSKLLCRRPWRGQLSPDTFRLAEYNILMPRDLPDPGRNTFVAADFDSTRDRIGCSWHPLECPHFRDCPSKAIPIHGLCDHWGVRHLLMMRSTVSGVGVCGDENDRYVAYLAEPSSGLDALAASFEINVHQDNIRRVLHR